jgi:hypothetical protein
VFSKAGERGAGGEGGDRTMTNDYLIALCMLIFMPDFFDFLN